MKTNVSSKSRARAFLWIMWFYLESDFTEEGCEENPFGAGVDYGVDVANQGVPELEPLTEEQEELENVDTTEEKEFGEAKREMRAKIIQADQQYMVDTQTKRGTRATRLFVPMATPRPLRPRSSAGPRPASCRASARPSTRATWIATGRLRRRGLWRAQPPVIATRPRQHALRHVVAPHRRGAQIPVLRGLVPRRPARRGQHRARAEAAAADGAPVSRRA